MTTPHRSAIVDRFSSPRTLGLLSGPVLGAIAYALCTTGVGGLGGGLEHATAATLALMVWMALWWLTEAVHISITALLPLVALPLLGVMSMNDAAAPYGSSIIFLFMGGFILALSMQRWGLDQRIALRTLLIVGTRPAPMIAGFMAVTAVLSAWVSNTATVAMMLPIVLSVIALQRGGSTDDRTSSNFARAILLGVAYAASIGGLATIIGSPPNGIAVEYMRSRGTEITFLDWMRFGVPAAAVMLPLTWLLLTKVLHPVGHTPIKGGRAALRERYRARGPMKRGEWATMIVFFGAAGLWISRQWLVNIELFDERILAGLTDAGIAMLAAIALFITPADKDGEGRRPFVMDWDHARQLPWGILILFGGGLSLAAAVQQTGVARLLADQVTQMQGLDAVWVVLAVTLGMVFLTELTSNTASAATLVPILAAIAVGLGIDPMMLVIPATLAASCAFMMPVATPPNAIVFGSGELTIAQMCRAGLWLNLIAVVVIVNVAYWV